MKNEYLDIAIKAAETSGEILVDYFEKLHDFKQKNANTRDLVTEVDVLSEKNIKSIIQKNYPDDYINAEESYRPQDRVRVSEGRTWIIDPLDGTVNYSQGIPLCAVSVAVEEAGDVVAGVIFNPFSQELFFASKGNGAYLSGRRISVSDKENIREGLYVVGFSSSPSEEKMNEYQTFGKINDATRGVLRIGSAALALAYLACSRVDGFWAIGLFPWDLAAGTIIVNEAGGRISSLAGGKYTFNDRIIVASNGLVHDSLLKKLERLKNKVEK